MTSPWRAEILSSLQLRNKKQGRAFEQIIQQNNKIADEIYVLRGKNRQLTVEAENLEKEKYDLQLKCSNGAGGQNAGVQSKIITTLEAKLANRNEELNELLRKKGEYSQQIIDLTNKVQEKEKEVQSKNTKIQELESKVKQFINANNDLQQNLGDQETANQILQDEMQALHMAFVGLEQKFRKTQDDNNELVTRWMQQKAQAADLMNAENDKMMKQKQEKIAKQLEEAAKETKEVIEPDIDITHPVAYVVTVPERALYSVEAHDSEVNAVRWSVSGRYFITGGADRKSKVWEVKSGKLNNICTFTHYNGGVTNVDIDYQDCHTLEASNDFTVRMSGIIDQKIKVTFTGHSGKVHSAKFLQGIAKVASGGGDRVVKIWDVKQGKCEVTLFTASTCFDLVTSDSLPTNVITGHFDHMIRFWDLRAPMQTRHEMLMQDKVTSLDLSCDSSQLLCSCRDDSLKIIDLRMNQVLNTFQADGFKLSSVTARAVFSPDAMYVACGSSNGSLYVWKSMCSSKVERVLKYQSAPIYAVSWDPKGSAILSCDKNKTVVYWSDF